MPRNAICLLTIHPHPVWIDFLNQWNHYDVYVFVDREYKDINDMNDVKKNMKTIYVSDEECRRRGFIHSSYMPYSSLVFPEIIAWDRALCFMTDPSTPRYDQVWFLEDDVFVYDETVLKNIDSKYPNSDILCKDKNPQPQPGEWCWFWPAVHLPFPEPYFHSPICAVRLSGLFLDKLGEYALTQGKLAFIEALFPSLVVHHGMRYVMGIEEMQTLHWRRDWDVLSELNTRQIFHPAKDSLVHKEWRRVITK